jgi:hypothetical protein
MLAFDDVHQIITGTFTEKRKKHLPTMEVWTFQTADVDAYEGFKANAQGKYFNANVRNSDDWLSVRVS